MGFTSHQQMHGEPSGRIRVLIGCSHFSGLLPPKVVPPSKLPIMIGVICQFFVLADGL
jgi:hypothetical protein